jgi:type 1 fimbria pilin
MNPRAEVCNHRPRPAMPILLLGLSALLLTSFPEDADAQILRFCGVAPQPAVLSFTQLNVSRDTAVGAPISEEVVSNVRVDCPGTWRARERSSLGFRMQVVPTYRVSNVVGDVWETGVPGIGLRVYAATAGRVVSNSYRAEIGPTIWSRTRVTRNFVLRHQLVKIGAIGMTGMLNFGAVYTFRNQSALTGNGGVMVLATVAIGTATLAPRSCRVTTPNVGVTLPNTQASTLGNNGASIGNTGFFIGLQCDDNTDVHITLTDATTPGNRTNLLSLTADSTARGVAVRVRRPDNAPVSFGPDSPAAGNTNQWRVGQRSGATTIPMSAEYVATGTVTAGTVRALATFTMSYH